VVLCDRYTDSSEAYQGGGRGLGVERVLALHQAVCDGLQPDLTILLLPDLVTSLHRARRRNTQHVEAHGTDENRFEREDDAFYQRIHAAYEAIAAREPERVVAIRDNGTLDEIEMRVREVVARRLPKSPAASPVR
jgi:dTMP kinase